MGANISDIAPNAGQKAHGPTDPAGKARLQKAVKEFEAIFIGYMLKSMRNTVPKDEMLGEGFGDDLMEGMFDGELAKEMSKQSNLGLAEMLYRGVTGEGMPHIPPATSRPPVPGAPVPPAQTAPPPAGSAGKHGHAVSAVDHQTVRSKQKAAVSDTVAQRVNSYAPFIEESAQRHGVDVNLLKAVIASESAGDSTARSPKDAKGLMQLVDTTAAAMGVRNVWDPQENIDGGAKYLQQLLERFGGNIEHAIASYNAGPKAVEKHGGIPPFKETREYVAKVMSLIRTFAQQEGGTND